MCGYQVGHACIPGGDNIMHDACVAVCCVCLQVRATIPLMKLEELLDEDVQVC
jgi:hypothetical protein